MKTYYAIRAKKDTEVCRAGDFWSENHKNWMADIDKATLRQYHYSIREVLKRIPNHAEHEHTEVVLVQQRRAVASVVERRVLLRRGRKPKSKG